MAQPVLPIRGINSVGRVPRLQRGCHAFESRILHVKRHGRLCTVCAVPLTKQKLFCSNSCQAEYQYRNYIAAWLDGQESGGVKYTVSNHVKRYLSETRGTKCESCGWHQVNVRTGKVPVQINHKDGNWRNNKLDNLELLCPNCHSLTETFGALNKGNGRAYRKEYSQFAVVAKR